MSEQVIILTDNELKFVYTKSEVIEFRRQWNSIRLEATGSLQAINEIARRTEQLPDNILLLALDQIRKGKIE